MKHTAVISTEYKTRQRLETHNATRRLSPVTGILSAFHLQLLQLTVINYYGHKESTP